MEITDVRVRKITNEGKMKAVVSMTIDNEFVVHDIKVIQGTDHLFVAMPSKRIGESGDFRDIAHPLTLETRNKIKSAILSAYEDAVAQQSAESGESCNSHDINECLPDHAGDESPTTSTEEMEASEQISV